MKVSVCLYWKVAGSVFFFDTYGFSKSSSIIHKTDSSHPNKDLVIN